MRTKTPAELLETIAEAERELDAATGRSRVNLAASKLMRAREALRRCEEQAAAAYAAEVGDSAPSS